MPVVAKTLVDVHDCMLEDARKERDAHLAIATTWEQFLAEIEAGNEVLVHGVS